MEKHDAEKAALGGFEGETKITAAIKEQICRTIARWYVESKEVVGKQWTPEAIAAITKELSVPLEKEGLSEGEISLAVEWFTSNHQSYWGYLPEYEKK